MGKIAFVFPGQGSQYVGMGKDFYDRFPQAKAVYDLAGEVTGLDVAALCFEENDKLPITEYTQIAMFTTEAAILSCALEKGFRADVCAGLSLGEYGALAAAEVMELSDLLRLVRQRGIYMQEACPEGGAMSAVLGADTSKVEEICSAVAGETGEVVSVANYNCPGQVVITGEASAVETAAGRIKEAGAKRCLPLKVSGPFHSALLKGAGEKLGEELKSAKVKAPKIPYYCNVEAKAITKSEGIKELLQSQVSSSVRWEQSVREMVADGVDTFIEMGPGKTLCGFLKKIDTSVKSYSIEKAEDLEKVWGDLHA